MISRSFIQIWHKWQHIPEPVLNFRNGRTKAPSYDIECALDHVTSSVYTLGSSVIGGHDWDYDHLASEEIVELNKIASELEICEMAESEKQVFKDYIAITRTLLEELKKVSTSAC